MHEHVNYLPIDIDQMLMFNEPCKHENWRMGHKPRQG